LVRKRTVTRFVFKPSGREIWIVAGRAAKYQVIPDSRFCSCADFYFRVVGRKKELCYHVIAQQLAEASNSFNTETLNDESYQKVLSDTKAAAT